MTIEELRQKALFKKEERMAAISKLTNCDGDYRTHRKKPRSANETILLDKFAKEGYY